MSVKLMTMAWETDAKANDLLILLAMCDFSSDDGVCYPSKATVAKKAKVGTTTCKHIMGAYEDIGLWKSEKRLRENGSSTSNVFIIDINKLQNLNYDEFKKAFQKRKKYTPKEGKKSQCDPLEKSHNVTPQSHNVTPQNENCDPLEPSTLNHHIEPSKKNKQKSRVTDVELRREISEIKMVSLKPTVVVDFTLPKADKKTDYDIAYRAYLQFFKNSDKSLKDEYVAYQKSKVGEGYVAPLHTWLGEYGFNSAKKATNSFNGIKEKQFEEGEF